MMNKIGTVACNEFRFDSFGTASALSVKSQLEDTFQGEQLLNYVNSENLNGLNCSGLENSLKECRPVANYDSTMPLFEISVECLCKYNF